MAIRKNIISKIPGEPRRLVKENQGYIDSISKLSDTELKDAIARQDKLINNKSFIAHLQDKGEKIKQFKDKLEKELSYRDVIKQTSGLFSNLKIHDPNLLEWTGKPDEKEEELDSDDLSDEEIDPLKLMASQGPNRHKKQFRDEKMEEPLITEEDIKESEEIFTDNHIKIVCKKAEEGTSQVKDRFKPFQTLNNAQILKKEKSKTWENTAATPPDPIYGQTKIINLQESLRLEKEHTLRVKDLQEKYATQRLAEKMGIKIPELNIKFNPESLSKYREEKDSESEKDSDVETLLDEEQLERDEAIIYNLID